MAFVVEWVFGQVQVVAGVTQFLEAALVGVPTVAADLEPYRMIRHGETGFLAANADDWYAGIMALAFDAAGRQEEIARMLSGAEITSEARAQADRLLEGV